MKGGGRLREVVAFCGSTLCRFPHAQKTKLRCILIAIMLVNACVIYQYDGQNKIKTPLKRGINYCELSTKLAPKTIEFFVHCQK